MSFLVFWFIFSSSSLVLFKNSPDYLTKRTALAFILLMRFLLYSLVSSSFLVLLRYFLKIYFFHHHFFMVSASGIPKYLQVSFSSIVSGLYSLRVFFNTSFSWLSFTRVWVTASLLRFPGFFSIFWPVLIMLQSGWSPLVFVFPSSPVSLLILRWLYQDSPITKYINVNFMIHSFSIPKQGRGTYPSFHFLSVLLCGQPGE